jgi:dihydropyrimidinase
LTDELYDRPGVAGALPVCAPPLRPEADRDALWRALLAGALDLVTTDHCPFTAEEKATGLANFSTIPGGVPSIESRLALVYAGLVGNSATPDPTALSRWVDVCCTTPARVFGFGRKGQLLPGYDADVVLFDPTRDFTISPDSLHETTGWTLYDGLTLHGWPTTTISRGEVIVNDGRWLGAAGRGRFVTR